MPAGRRGETRRNELHEQSRLRGVVGGFVVDRQVADVRRIHIAGVRYQVQSKVMTVILQ